MTEKYKNKFEKLTNAPIKGLISFLYPWLSYGKR